MNIPSQNIEVTKAHALYCRLTGYELPMRFDRERFWFEFLKQFTLADLELVIQFLQRAIRRGERNEGALRFRNLICQPDYFDEELSMAKKAASARKRKPAEAVNVTRKGVNNESVSYRVEQEPEKDAQKVVDSVREELARFKRAMGRV